MFGQDVKNADTAVHNLCIATRVDPEFINMQEYSSIILVIDETTSVVL